jgi:glycosyltransferase involved in cell wall biosynthesis
MLVIDNLIEEIEPDLIHCNAAVGLPLLAVSRMRGIPLIQWVRIADLDGFMDHLVSADMITVVSAFIARETAKQMVRADKVRVLYDCVDTDRFSPGTEPPRKIRAELGITEDEFVVLCIARFVPYKRIDVLIRAIAMTARRHSSVRLIIIGERQSGADTYEKAVLAIQELGLGSRTTLLGFQHDVLSFEAAADTVVLCSEREPLGTVVLESMALGRPVIVAASGGLIEMIEDEVSGLYCQPNDPYSLSKQICRLIESRTLREAFGKRARECAVEVFSMNAHAGRLLSLYQELIESLIYARALPSRTFTVV